MAFLQVPKRLLRAPHHLWFVGRLVETVLGSALENNRQHLQVWSEAYWLGNKPGPGPTQHHGHCRHHGDHCPETLSIDATALHALDMPSVLLDSTTGYHQLPCLSSSVQTAAPHRLYWGHMAMRKRSCQGIGSFFPYRKGILIYWQPKTTPPTVDELEKKNSYPMGNDNTNLCVCVYVYVYVD